MFRIPRHFFRAGVRALPRSSRGVTSLVSSNPNLLEGYVHENNKTHSSFWRNKPLFRRDPKNPLHFRTGKEASELLIQEVQRRDGDLPSFLDTATESLEVLSEVFERDPRMPWVAKVLLEPERMITFRVSYVDDSSITRVNRAYRCQWSSALGPYTGSLHFGQHVSPDIIKSLAYSTTIRNAMAGLPFGGACGGSDFDADNKSDGEIQRFCQSFMTELSKYVGPGQDIPSLGMGVSLRELGYMEGQFKRIKGGGDFMRSEGYVKGHGVVHFANAMLSDKKISLRGKRCLILGSGKVAMAVASKLEEYGAIPLTFSDHSGIVYEPNGFLANKLRTIRAIKKERGARVGRYIISSTSCEFNEVEEIFDIKCDLVFPCNESNSIGNDEVVQKLVNGGCKAVIEGGHNCVSPSARKAIKKKGMAFAPGSCTLLGPELMMTRAAPTDDDLKEEMSRIHSTVARTATEFNSRGDLYAGAQIAGFLRVSGAMDRLGAV